MYELVSGPLVWLGFIILIGGTAYRLVSVGLMAKREKSVFPTMSAKFGLRSLLHWLVPYNSVNMRARPVMTLVSFCFHVCLLVTPLFAMGHAVMWEQAWGFSWWSLPPLAADVMTLVVIIGVTFFILRRIAAPEVRNVSSWKDFAIALLVVSPFLTGFISHQQWLPARPMLILHIITGVVWLAAIPFTRLAHVIWFVFTRAYMGSEFGAVRRARDW